MPVEVGGRAVPINPAERCSMEHGLRGFGDAGCYELLIRHLPDPFVLSAT